MKLIAQVRLNPTPEHATYLLETLEAANALCNRISAFAWENYLFGKFALQKALYHPLRADTGITAQMVVRMFAKVSDAYKLDKKHLRTFKSHGAIAYDDRILRYYTDKEAVSIWSIGGRLHIPYSAGERQKELLQYQQGESDLVYSKTSKEFFLLATCDIPDPDQRQTDEALGIDMGVTNIAVTSDGDIFSSESIEYTRKRYAKLRKALQQCGSKSAKRHLKKMAGRQQRFQKDVNHVISKRLVMSAKDTNRSIKVENLTHIRVRTTVGGSDKRAKYSNWAFAQLQYFLAYKARMHGVKLEQIDPRYTSQRCFVCGHIAKANRKTQDAFLCCACGYIAHADINAAKNIAFWAAVKPPIVTGRLGQPS
ncbi:MAG: transposase [Chloroflexi bacterium]|nr:transposase [Chloroflexota bacterium]MCC6897116.1 transposase [Anaerolineae bacterium]